MSTTPYTVVINGHQVQCDSASSVIALIGAAGGHRAAAAPAAASASAAAAPAKTRKRRGRAAKKTVAAKTVAAPAAAPKVKKGKKRGRKPGAQKVAKAAGLSKRSVTFLTEFAKSGGSTLSADRLAKATGAKGPKGVGGSLTALARELKSFGYNLENLISRKKSLEEGTTWNALPGCDKAVNEILSRVPVVG